MKRHYRFWSLLILLLWTLTAVWGCVPATALPVGTSRPLLVDTGFPPVASASAEAAEASPAPTTNGGQQEQVTPTVVLPIVTKGYVPPEGVDVTLTVDNPSASACADEPVTSGIPIPRSANLTNLGNLRLWDSAGRPVPVQFAVLSRWGGAPGDSARPVRWLLLDFQADVAAGAGATYRLTNLGGTTPTYPTLNLTDSAGEVTIDTGAAVFHLSKTDGQLSGPQLAAPVYGQAVDVAGTTYTTSGPVDVTIETDGAMRVAVRVEGSYQDSGGTALLDYTSRYWFYAGRSTVRLFHTVENNNLCPLDEYQQLLCNDIGSGGSVTVSDLSLVLPTSLGSGLTYQVAGQGTPVGGNLTADLLLYQDSSGTDNWDHYPTLTDWDGNPLDARPRMQTYVAFRGYNTTLGGGTVDSGNQAVGWLSLAGSAGSWTAGVRDFWQNFPKALRAAPDGTIEVGLFPDEFGPADYGFNLRAGEYKTHEVVLAAGPVVLLTPLFARAPAEWYVDSGALGLAAARDRTAWPDYEYYIDYQLDTSPDYQDWMDWFPNLPAALEGTDFYGLWDYGDWPLDYEGFHVSPLNTKYDYNLGTWLQWLRTGDVRWFQLASSGNRHLADVDILHNLHSPRHWGDGIAFGHSYHDEEGFVNPHRNYGGNHPDTAFGTAGLLLTYYLTGYDEARDAGLELADCIEFRLHNDVNLCSYFPGDCTGEGYALGDGLWEGGERPAANNLYIASEVYRATGDSRYLDVADALVQWADPSVQPYISCTPISGDERTVRPWTLNLYLRSLADYIEVRDEYSLPDPYAARTDFLAYTDWLRSCAWLDVAPIDTGARGAYPYWWFFDGRTGIPGEDNDNADPAINNWLVLSADALAYAYHLSGDADYLERAARLFRAGSRDPWFEGDANTYDATKETANSITYGNTFLYEWTKSGR